MARRLHQFEPERSLEKERKGIQELGGQILVHGDSRYPSSLLQIPEPPPVLYLLGQLKKEDKIALSIVGSRAASSQGRLNAERIAGKLAGMGITIVSGLAMGIDTWAHKGALMAGGRTLAVLGCGLDYNYPRYNSALKERIAEQGAVISEFPLGTPPLPMNFPRRNRIISGMSMGTLVVEAAKKSGSLITVNFALEQGRDVYAIPGNIDSPLSSGVNGLIQKGAKLIQGVDDIIEEFPLEVLNYIAENEKRPEKSPVSGSRQEMLVLKLLKKQPVHIDELTCQTSMAPAEVSSLLMKMELKGQVRQLPGKLFTRF
jgi:DNA processing protein